MKKSTRVALLATMGLVTTGIAENGTELIRGMFDQTNHTPKILFDVRARYEHGDQENLEASHAATLRARIGLESQDYNGFTGLVEFEATRAADTTSYAEGLYEVPSSGQTVIADPENTEINRAQLQFKRNDNTAIVGRQRIILDNARFIGNVGWRQNEQTYDAFSYKNTMIEDVSLFYGYIDTVKRIFGSGAPTAARQWESDSHLLNASYKGLEGHTFTGYGYFLDFDNAQLNSTDTIGGSWMLKTKMDEYAINGHLELAYQEEGSDAPIEYSAMYAHLNGSVAREGYSFIAGYELLGSDDGIAAFKTPLATGHKFNGWNDQFLTTPLAGLQDFYAGIGVPVPKVPMKFIYHYFRSDSGSIEFGHEFNALATHALNKKTKLIAKLSHFESSNEAAGALNNNRLRFSIEVNYKY